MHQYIPMKNSAVLLALLFVQWPTMAQNKNLEAKYGIKVYNLSSYTTSNQILSQDSVLVSRITDKFLSLFNPSIAFRFKTKRNNFHEIEWTTLRLDNQESYLESRYTGNGGTEPVIGTGARNMNAYLALRYEYIINFFKNKNSRWMPSLGIAVSPYFSYSRYTPFRSSQFAVRGFQMGLTSFLIPRINYQINNRFFADLNFPIAITDMYVTTDRINDPNLPSEAQRRTVRDGALFPQPFYMRIGLGMRL